MQDELAENGIGYYLRLRTLTRLRWLAVLGQTVAVIAVKYGLGFSFPYQLCFALIASSALLNTVLSVKYPATHLLKPKEALLILGYDLLQLIGLLYITGGLSNPFSVLICVPVIISSSTQPISYSIALGLVAFVGTTFLTVFHLPLPWYGDVEFTIPFLLLGGMWIAIVSTAGFAAFYAHRVSSDENLFVNALAETELILQREQHLTALDGLAAAAAHELGTPLATICLVSKEMERALVHDDRFREDVLLLRSQSLRCRDILKRLTTLTSEGEVYMAQLPFSSLVEEVVAPHREFGVDIVVKNTQSQADEPIGKRSPGILYGLGNIIENAVDFARTQALIVTYYDKNIVQITISDDGPGFAPDILSRLGSPFVTKRQRGSKETAGGMGLGLFIAKTLLERSGARVDFGNRKDKPNGAFVSITWPRSMMEHVEIKEVNA